MAASESKVGNNGRMIGDQLAYGIDAKGAACTVGEYKGYLQSVGNTTSGDVKTYKDASGATCTLVIPEIYTEATCEILLLKTSEGAALPAKGEEVTLPSKVKKANGDTGTWRLETLTVNWKNEDVTSCSITARTYPF